MSNNKAYDFFGAEIKVGDTVAALGSHYQSLYLYTVLSISPQKVRLQALTASANYTQLDVCSKFHKQCIVKPDDKPKGIRNPSGASSWEGKVDTQSGAFTQDEIDNATAWR